MQDSLEKLELDLAKAFPHEQARLLANKLHEGYETLAKAVDLEEVKLSVGDIKAEVAGMKTEIADIKTEMRDVREAQKRTDIRVNELAKDVQILKEDVSILKEDVSILKEDVSILKSDVSILKSDVSILKSDVSILKKDMSILKGDMESLKGDVKNLQISVTNLAKQMGGLSEAFGGTIEDFALEFVPEILQNYWQLKVLSCRREEIETGSNRIEFDLFLEGELNGKKMIVLGEVKSRVTLDEVRKFFKLVEKVKPSFPNAEVRVIFFGYRIFQDVRDSIQYQGGYSIFSNGKML